MNAATETMRLARLGMPQLAAMAATGKLRGRHLGLAIEGASEYHEAIASGDVASEEDQDARASTCSTCPNLTPRGFRVLGLGRVKFYCGEPFEADESRGRCGCPIGTAESPDAIKQVRVEHPGPRLMVASKQCPSGRFRAVERVSLTVEGES